MATPDDVVDVINDRYGSHPGHRALHAKGILCRGTFTATPEAAVLSRAGHLQGEPVTVTARLSNGGGNPRVPDYAPDVRGLAVKFTLADGTRTDIVAQSAPRFPVDSAEAFMEFVRAGDRSRGSAWRMPLFLLRNPRAIPGMPTNLKAVQPPTSYATIPYWAVHAFRWVAADDAVTHVRYTLEPEDHEPPLGVAAAKARGRDYLQDDVRSRLASGGIRFRLVLQVAEEGDDVDDPRSVWPDRRLVVDAGTIELTELETEREKDGDILVFDPTRVVDGIELTDDPILQARSAAYSASVERRTR